MVRLRRGAAPALLRTNGHAWTQRWQEMHAAGRGGDWATFGAKKVLSAELQKLAFGKCAFCESLLGVSGYLETEHYAAKTVSPEQAFEWTNLFPVCRWCNRAKGDMDHGGTLLKPDFDDPESMLWLHPDTGELQPKPKMEASDRRRVERTLEICQLLRGPLCMKRIDTMESTIRWLERLSRRQGRADAPLLEEWRSLIDPRTEYKFVIRHVFEIRGESRLAEEDRIAFK
jgi:uncharacterized protein (TIGR02646 family)